MIQDLEKTQNSDDFEKLRNKITDYLLSIDSLDNASSMDSNSISIKKKKKTRQFLKPRLRGFAFTRAVGIEKRNDELFDTTACDPSSRFVWSFLLRFWEDHHQMIDILVSRRGNNCDILFDTYDGYEFIIVDL